MITIHDPSWEEVQRAVLLVGGWPLSREWVEHFFELVVESPAPGGCVTVGGWAISWDEPDETGLTPFTIRRV